MHKLGLRQLRLPHKNRPKHQTAARQPAARLGVPEGTSQKGAHLERRLTATCQISYSVSERPHNGGELGRGDILPPPEP